jgi:hypothetical protein
MLDGKERLDCVSCPEREAGMAEEAMTIIRAWSIMALATITASLVRKVGMICLEQRVSRIDRMSDDRQSTVIECQLYTVRSKLNEG